MNRIRLFALAALVLASWIVELVVLQHGTDYPAHFLAGVRDLFTRNFFRDPGAFGRLNEAILLLEGIALFYCTRRLATLAGVLVSPGEFYGPAGKSFIRVAVVQPDEQIALVADRLRRH